MEALRLLVSVFQLALALAFAVGASATLRKGKQPEALFCSLLCIINAIGAFA